MDTSIPYESKRNINLFIIVLTGMFILDKLAGIALPDFLYVIVIALFFAFSDFESIIYKLCYMFPLSFLFESIAYIWLITLAMLMVKAAWKSDSSRKTFKIQPGRSILILFFILLEFNAHRLYGISDTNRMGGYMLTVALLLYLLYDKRAQLDYLYSIKLYIYGTFALCALFIINAMINAPSNWVALLASGMLRFGGTVNSKFGAMTVNLNANTLAYFSIVGVASSLSIMDSFNNMRVGERIIYIAQFALVSVIGMLTVSRSWVLAMAIILLLFFFSQMKTPRKAITVLVATVVIGLFVFMVFSQGSSSILNAFVARFTNGEVKTLAGRTDIYSDYMKAFNSNGRFMLFGTGVTDYVDVTGMWQSLHNGLQQILICLGIPGAIVFLIALLRPILTKENRQSDLVHWLPFVAVVTFTQTIQFLNPNLLMLPFVIGLYGIRNGIENVSSKAYED